MPVLFGKSYTREELLKCVGDVKQVAGIEPIEYTEGSRRGCRALLVRNAAGLDLTVLVDRGLGIDECHYRGIPLAFRTPVGPVHPAFFSDKGRDWLKTWPGGLLAPCGLTYLGAPCVDGGVQLGLHGRVGAIPAENVQHGIQWDTDGNARLRLQGLLREYTLFSEHVSLCREIVLPLDAPRITITDVVTNHGHDPAPLMLLQHINLGFPLVSPAASLVLPPCNTIPRDADARRGLRECCHFSAPVKGYREQVFYHDCVPDPAGEVQAGVINPCLGAEGLGVVLRYQKADYPVLVEWKMIKEGTYVVGVEPANCRVEGRAKERLKGTLTMLQPGEARRFRLGISIIEGKTAIADFMATQKLNRGRSDNRRGAARKDGAVRGRANRDST